jgi:uncharacterized protein (TIGR02996 family)
MNTEDAFLHSIREHPEDDTPRRIFGDWLADQDDPLGEFIHAQFARAAVPDTDPEHAIWRAREKALLARHHEAWLARLGDLPPEVRPERFERGFLASVRLHPTRYLVSGEELFARHPIDEIIIDGYSCRPVDGPYPTLPALPGERQLRSIAVDHLGYTEEPRWGPLVEGLALPALRELRLAALPEGIATFLVRAGWVSQIRKLRLDNSWRFTEADTIVQSPAVRGLEDLELQRLPQPANLARYDHLVNLRRLALHFIVQDPSRCLAGASRAHFPALRELRLSGCAVTPAALRRRLFAHLETLDLQRSALDDDGYKALTRSSVLEGLRSLRLSGTRPGDTALTSLGQAANLQALHLLDLSTNNLGARVAGLAGARALPALQILRLSYGKIGADHLATFSAGFPGQLRILDLSWNPLGDAGATILTTLPGLDRLTALNLACCEIGDAGLITLSSAPWLSGLRTLDLGTNRLGDAGLAALLRAPLDRLEILNLAGTHLGPRAIPLLRDWPRLRRLRALVLPGELLPAADLRTLADDFPGHLGY